MNLFELLVKIGVKDEASKNIANITEKLGNGLKTAAKIGTAAVGVAATGITALTTAAVKNYAEYEQLVGGVDTLFKGASQKVKQYASDAYKTAGMSANDYMENATAFSASLINALGGDTEAAAEYANRAMISMSDNANKMGTNIDSIVQTYQSLSRGNFAMLDNLKLGYGGTKEELERLIKDASTYTDIQKEMGITVDASSMSFDNIVNAIAVVQGHLGIAGATALEAGTTIEGSVNSMKAAWDNLITGIADDNADFETLVDNFITTLVGDGSENNLGVFGNLLPRVEVALGGIGKLVENLAPIIAEGLPILVTTLLPSILESAISLISSLAESFPMLLESALPTILNAILGIIDSIVNTLTSTDVINKLLSTVTNAINSIIKSAPKIIESLVKLIPIIITGLVNSINDILPVLIEASVQLVQMLVDNIGDIIQSLVDAIPTIIETLSETLIQNFPTLLTGVIDLVLMLVQSLPEVVQMLVDQIAPLVSTIVEVLVANAPLIIAGIVQIVFEIVKALPQIMLSLNTAFFEAVIGIGEGLVDAYPAFKESLVGIITKIPEWFAEKWEDVKQLGKDIVTKIKDGLAEAWTTVTDWVTTAWDAVSTAFKDLWEDMKEVGGYIISGIWEGLKSAWQDVVDWIEDAFDALGEGVKKLLGIESPSKWYRDVIGKNIVLGLEKGLSDNEYLAVNAMEKMSEDVKGAFDTDYDMSYSIGTVVEPYDDSYDNGLTRSLKSLVALEENRAIDVSISVNSDDSELSRMLLSMLKVTAKEVYANA